MGGILSEHCESPLFCTLFFSYNCINMSGGTLQTWFPKFKSLPLLVSFHNQNPSTTKSNTLSYSYSYTSSSSSSSMDSPPQGYRRNVGICRINPSKKIFSASRMDIPSAWQMPQPSAEVIAEVPFWLTYDFPPEVSEKLKHQWGSDWRGQAQKWFLLKFTGKDEEINLLGDGTEKAEFGEWSWISPEQIVELAVDFNMPVYKEVMTVFAPYFQST
ncbi:hypothetical protein ACB098_11G094200 [Castanea mollissima]